MTPAERVKNTFYDCMFKTAEEANEHVEKGTIVTSKGMRVIVAFHPERLKGHEEGILALMNEVVHDKFYRDGGGGMSFLDLCVDKNGNQWTDLHQTMDQFFQLAQAIGHAGFCTQDPGLISLMPGGMPFVWFSKEKVP